MLPSRQKIMAIRAKLFGNSTALFLLAAMTFLYCFLFKFPFLPIGVSNIGDSLLYLAPGQRLYQGEMIYRDFFEFVTPGTGIVYWSLFKVFGLRLWVPNLLVMLLGLGMVWLGVVIARKLTRPSLVLLPSSLFLVETLAYLCDPVHHWFSALAGITAIAVLLEKRTTARIAAAGFFCGISACFTQTRGLAVFAGVAVFLCWESRRRLEGWRGLFKKLAWLIMSFVATFLAVNAYFIWKAGPARYFWCTVVFVLKYYPKEADWNTLQSLKLDFPTFVFARAFLHSFTNWLFLFVLTPLLFVLFFLRYFKDRRKTPREYWERPMLVAIVGLFMFLCVAPAPNANRMSVSALPALLLLGWFLDSPRKLARVLSWMLAVGIGITAVHALARRIPVPIGILSTPQGKLAITNQTAYDEYVWIQQHTKPGEYFYQADYSDQYYYLDLRNPTPIPRDVNNGYTTAEQVAEEIQGLEKHHVQYIFWRMDDPDIVPSWENPADAHLGPLRDYLHSHYKLVRVFAANEEMWERNS